MTEQQIIELLEELAEVRAGIDLLNADRAIAQAAAIPAEVQQTLADIEAEYEPVLIKGNEKAKALEAEIKAAVLEHGASIKNAEIQAIYTKGRVTWNADALDGYAVNHPELFAFRKEGKPSVSIR